MSGKTAKRTDNRAASLRINLTASKLTTIGKQKVSLERGLRYWADSPLRDPQDLVLFQRDLSFPKVVDRIHEQTEANISPKKEKFS